MTYCVGMQLADGFALMSDTRTNAGLDNVSHFRKMFTWQVPGERFIALMTAGNLATTQAVVSQLEERTKSPQERRPSLLDAPTMFQVATEIGETLRNTIAAGALPAQEGQKQASFRATLILAGQIKGMEPRMFMIYPEGNFIEASSETPFFQTGETKYGRPILVRAYEPDMPFSEVVKLFMVSFDSTLKANLSVGAPFDLLLYRTDDFEPLHERRIDEDDPYYQQISNEWSSRLREAFNSLPEYDLDVGDDPTE